jgi:hypothetical protein
MSFLKSKHSGWTWEMTRTPFMGGGGGGGQAPPTQTTAYNTNVPEYARPYVENMLESTQKQIYTDDMAGFRPYRPYSTDPNNYVAGFSPLQQQAQQATAGLRTPGQFGDATTLAGTAGLGALGYGGMGVQAAQQGFGAGQQYAQNVTSPQSMQAYMSPYQQNVTDIAKTAAVREAQMAQNAQNLGAARQGTYGGARQTLAQAEREKNLLSNLSNIQAQGSQSAYDRALQSQQFGANLGLQGLQAGYGGLGLGLQGSAQAGQAASTLGQLGGQQLGAQKEIIGLQSQMGAQQQAQEQQKINQAIQDYAIAQQYPFMQLGQMNAMLRGLPLQTQTTQLYQAQPSALQQGIGLAGAAGTFFGGRNREGGTIKEYREGGITQSYALGGRINPESEAVNNVQMQLSSMDVNELREVAAKNPSEQIRQMASELLAQKEIAAAQTQKSRMSGIATAGGGMFDTMGMAGGGILAFSNGGDPGRSAFQQDLIDMLGYSKEEDTSPFERDIKPKLQKIKSYFTEPRKYTPEQLEDIARNKGALGEGSPSLPGGGLNVAPAPVVKEEKAAAKEGTSGKSGTPPATPKDFKSFLSEIKEAGPKGQVGEEFEKFLGEQMGDPNRLSRKERLAMAKGFLEFGSTAGPIGTAAIKGLGTYATGAEAARDAEDKIKSETAKASMELDKARRAESRGDVAAARESMDKYEDRMSRIQAAQIGASTAGAPQRYTEQQIRSVMAENPGMSYTEALTRVAGAGRTENVEVQRAKAAQEALSKNIPYLRLMQSKKPEDQAKAKQIRDEIFGNFGLLTPGGGIGGGQGGSGNLVPNKDGSFNYVPR